MGKREEGRKKKEELIGRVLYGDCARYI